MVNPTYLIAAGGILGALLRHFISEAIEDETIPLGTLTVNVLGSFVLGLMTFLQAGPNALLLVGTGITGSFTTFSSFSVDVVQLWEDDKRLLSAGYAIANLAGALAAIGLAWLLAQGILSAIV